MNPIVVLLVFSITSLPSCLSDKILVVSFLSSKSHKITYMPLVEELAERGHQITIVTPVKSSRTMKNIKEIFTLENATPCTMAKMEGGKFNIFHMKESGRILNPFLMVEEFAQICKLTYDLPQIKALLHEKFDLVLFQPMFNECALGLIHKIQAPLVLFVPVSVPSIIVSKIGGYFPPSFVGNVFLGYNSDAMNFYERFINFGMELLMDSMLRWYYEPYMTALYREKLGQEVPSVAQILGNASLLLSNGHFSLNRPRPYFPDVVEVGGIHSRPAKPLPKEFEKFASQSGDNGFILFSMGSAYKGDSMPEDKRTLFISVFSKLKQNILWKWESESMPLLPKNVKLTKWFPQQDLLGHKNARIFITHCGAGSTEEAIYHGVPLIGIPFYGDQGANANQAEQQGILVKLDWNSLTEDKLMEAIQQILKNSSYRENIQKLSKVFKDQPNHPLDRGVFWIEYVLRHKGAPQLRSASRNLNWIQYHSIDVIAVYIALVIGLLSIFCVILKFMGRICGCCSKTSKDEQRKKDQ